jgi:beta-aspartyl-peptidase (threonine type)
MHKGRRIQLKTQDLDLVSVRYSIIMTSLSHPTFISINLIPNEIVKKMTHDFGILIHVGAGNRSFADINSGRTEEIRKLLELTASQSYDILAKSNTETESTCVLNATEAAVMRMEDSGLFDAGIRGSYLTSRGQVEMDAAIMNGRDLSAGSVGMVKNIKNPVRVARLVMQRTDHVMLVSRGVTEFGRLLNLEFKRSRPTTTSLAKYNLYKKNENRVIQKEWPKNSRLYVAGTEFVGGHYGTVGAVAIDRAGNTASAVSTGGRWFKMSGRIGDSAIIGSGLYADNGSGAACATGIGEFIMRLCLAKEACIFMRKYNAKIASKKAIRLLSYRFGRNSGGIITVDKYGHFGMDMNTLSMPIAICTNHTRKAQIAFNRRDAKELPLN